MSTAAPYRTRIAYERLYSVYTLQGWLRELLHNADYVEASICADRILTLKGYR